jgi:hypothetical protein
MACPTATSKCCWPNAASRSITSPSTDGGDILELSRGVFRRADAPPPSYPDLLAVAYRSPLAIVCCRTAAAIHELSDEIPPVVQIAVPTRSRPPRITYPPTEVFRFDEASFERGLSRVEAAPRESVRIYTPARTVIDLMRWRGRFGEPLAHGALQRYLRRRDARPAEAAAPGRRAGRARPGAPCSRRGHGAMSRPTRGTPAGQAHLDLQDRARTEGRGTQELLTLYVVQRWLARLSASPYVDQFVLKGGTLLAAFNARRPTADADALARDFANDEATVVGRVVAIADQPVPDDGVEFRTRTATSRVIRDEDLYSGVRIAMDCAIATAIIKLRLDTNFGDPVTPAPQLVDLPALRPGEPPIRILGYPLETVLAEKIATAIVLGPANTRVRDYADVYTHHLPDVGCCCVPVKQRRTADPEWYRSGPRGPTTRSPPSSPTRSGTRGRFCSPDYPRGA